MRALPAVTLILLSFVCLARAGAPRCADGDRAAILASPAAAVAGGPLRLVAVAEAPLDAALEVVGPDGARVALDRDRRGGPPYSWYVETTAGRAGTYRATLTSSARVAACREVHVDGDGASRERAADGAWPIAREWDRPTEDLFSAWVERLFDAPLGEEPSWHGLDEVTRDPARNFLHEHLGRGEDGSRGLRLVPDCADLPYFLRAYFAWKLGLPFGYSECSRGDGGRPPRCGAWHSNREPAPTMQRFFDRVADVVQSGAGRTPAEDDRTDLYPVRLAPETLRPGTVYADPYGHTLVVVRRVPQTETTGGLLLAVDAQPDATVARKRYWRGNFLFAVDPSLGGPGFKHFRPIVRDGAGLRPLTNREIAANADYGDYSPEQARLDVEAFYDRVDDLLSPAPRDPTRAFTETIDALDEQVHARVRSVANGETYQASHAGTIAMPDGPAIFETIGPWEDYATPSRDLRLLIAIDAVRGFPDKVAARPARFTAADRPPDALRRDLQELLRQEAGTRHFEYTRSDGSPWTLTLADVMARAEALEVAYDPNDCIEIRWGAAPGSDEVSTCRRHAPPDQAARLARYRPWFHERRRPPR